jgi:hypothetical protein
MVAQEDDTTHTFDAPSPFAHNWSNGLVVGHFGSAGFGTSFGTNKQGGSTRYINVPMLREATIASAIMTFNSGDTTGTTTPSGVFDADDVDDSPRITSDGEWDAIAKTSATVGWTISEAWIQNEEYESPELKTIVKEWVDRPGHEANQALTVFLHDEANASPDFHRRIWWAKLAGPSPSDWPHLFIDYSGGIGGEEHIRQGVMMGSADVGIL